MKLAAVEAVARVLNEAGVPFLVVGGLAVIAHGYVRTTQDIDLVIRLEPSAIRRAFAALLTIGYRPTVPVTGEQFADVRQREGWARDKGMTVLSFFSDHFRGVLLDVFITEPFDFEAEYAAAKVDEVASGVPVRVVRLTTLINLKRAAGRPQDLADIAELEQIEREQRDG
ncbi:MAG TPA: hypothetical protein VD997_14990 [Phycisphaerales bacterium]|nr:hypothetical protein [Phycisphaerales bacterium]